MGFLVEMGAAIPSKAFDVWRKLYARFQLEPGPAIGSTPEVGTSIIPVTQVDELLRFAALRKSALFDLSGGGSLILPMLTVPSGERWRLGHMFRTSTVGGTRMAIIDPDGTHINLQQSGTAERVYEPGFELVLDEGWSLGMGETGNGSDTAEQITAYVTIENAFN